DRFGDRLFAFCTGDETQLRTKRTRRRRRAITLPLPGDHNSAVERKGWGLNQAISEHLRPLLDSIENRFHLGSMHPQKIIRVFSRWAPINTFCIFNALMHLKIKLGYAAPFFMKKEE